MTLGLLVPTRERPHSAVELAKQVGGTCNSRFTTLVFVIDHDDPHGLAYRNELYQAAPWAEVVTAPPKGPKRLGPVLNWAAGQYCDDFDFLGFMGDDHRPRTPLWDEQLCWSLAGKPGVAYGDDLLQRQRLPTACVIDARIVRALGYMAPPPLVHLYFDDFWLALGEATQLVYRRDVVVEHLHPTAGKARPDRVYAESGMNIALLRDDGSRYQQWLQDENGWPRGLKRLKEALGAA